jgi:AcrR family transcriptional regulator
MRNEIGSGGQPGILTPSLPRDIGSRAQQQRILVAMTKSCAEKSFVATTIADVVGQANISRATFYKHFANKRECFDAAVEGFVAKLRHAAVDAQASAQPRPAAIRRAIDAILELLAAEPAYARLSVIEAPILEPIIVADHRDQAIDALKEQWGTGKGDEDTRADARLAFGRAHMLVADYVTADKAKQLPELLPEIVYVLLLPFIGHKEALAQVKLAR